MPYEISIEDQANVGDLRLQLPELEVKDLYT